MGKLSSGINPPRREANFSPPSCAKVSFVVNFTVVSLSTVGRMADESQKMFKKTALA
jgi:hypothetical protein